MSGMTTSSELTETDRALCLTAVQIAETRAKSLVFDGGDAVALPVGTPPALAGAAARLSLGGAASFAGLNQYSQPVYRLERKKPWP